MKHKVKRVSKSSLSVVLSLCMLFSCFTAAFVATDAATIDSASVGMNISAGTLYVLDTSSWGSVNMYYWGSDWNNNVDFSNISGTKIYYYTIGSTWTDLTGYKMRQTSANWDKAWSSDGTSDPGGTRWFTTDSTTAHSTLANMNGAAQVVTMIDSGSGYTQASDTSCVATVSGVNLANSATSTTSVTASTGSSSSASINVAYGSKITYTAVDSGSYVFKGFSTTSSSSLPSSIHASGHQRTATANNGSANSVVYAYFEKQSSDPDFAIIGDLDKLATIGSSAPDGVGHDWPGTGTFVKPTTSGQNALKTGSNGVYSLTFTTGDYSNINIGLYQIGADTQRGFYVDGTYYNTPGSDYTVPYNGVSAADNCYAVDGTGSIILQPDTEYTITIDQTQPLDSSNPYGKITITTNKKQITAVAKVKRRDTTTNLHGSVTNATAAMGTAVADPTVGTTGFRSTLTATVTDTDNYTFSGWYSDENCTTSVSANAEYTVSSVTSDVKYYALFLENELPTLHFTATSGDNGTVSPASGTVLKGGSVTLTATPSTGYIIDTATSTSGAVTVTQNDNDNTATITVSNITVDNTEVNVTFKRIETHTVTVSADSDSYGKVSITYYNENGVQTTTSNIGGTAQTFNVQKDKVVTLIGTTQNSGTFNGWQVVSGTYQRSKDTPFSATTLNIKPTSSMNIKGLFGVSSSDSSFYLWYASSANQNDLASQGKMKYISGASGYAYMEMSVPSGNTVCSFTESSTSWISTYNGSAMTDPQSITNNIERKENSQNYYNFVNFKNAGTVYYVVNTSSPYDAYVTDVNPAGGGSGTDDTPDKTGAQKLYVLDGIDGDNNSGGTLRFGDSIISKAPSGVLKYSFYDGTDADAVYAESTGHSEEGGNLYYYKTTEDLSFRVQTTIDSAYPAIGVRAFVMNGKTYEAKKDSDGNYYADISMPAGNYGTLEVIPVYKNILMDDTKDCIYFEVDATTLGNSWGKTIGYSAWFSNGGHGVCGAYPGQPLLSNGNILYGYIPKYYVAPEATSLPAAGDRKKFSGVLLTNLCEHNAIHEDVMEDWGIDINDDNRNYQTFDYEDPVKIASIAGVDTIKFIVKYEESNSDHRTNTHFVTDYSSDKTLNGDTSSTWPLRITAPTSSNLNGFEVLTDIDGNAVDIYGNKITGGADFSNSVFVISVGNQEVGGNAWDTVWMVYDGSDKSFIKANNPAEFINVASTSQSDDLKGKTVYINYEKFLDGKAKDPYNSGDRIDGRWVYSKTTDDTTVRLRVATRDAATGELTFLTTNGINVAEITDGTRTGPIEAADATHYTRLLELENRTTDVTAKINVKGYKVEDFYMLKSSYAVTSANNGFSTNINDYDALNVNGTGYTFKNTKDNRMVIVIKEIPAEDLAVFHQEYKGDGAHNITGVYYAKVEMYDAKNGNPIDMSSSPNRSKYGVFKNTLNQFTNFVYDAPKNINRYLKITLKTTMPPSAQFYQWYENDHNGGYNLIDSTAARGSEDPVETVVWVPVADLYGDKTDNLSIVNLDYYSDLQSGDSVDIHHDLTTATINNGMDGNTYIQVKVMDALGNTVSRGDLGTKLSSTNVDSSFITEDNADAGYQLEVNIWTVPDSPAQFDKFYIDDGTTVMTSTVANGIRYYYDGTTTATGGYKMATAVIPIDYFFKEVDNGSGTLIKVVDPDKKNFYLYSSLIQSSRQIQVTKSSDVSGDTTDFNFIVEYKDGSNWIAAEGTYTGAFHSGNLTSTGQGTVRVGETVTITLTGNAAVNDLRVSEVTSATHTPSGVTVTNATNVTSADSSVIFTPGDSPISVVTISNKKKMTLTITKTADENTNETFDFYVYKWNANASPADYELITTDPGFTYSGSGTFNNSTHKLTLSKDETASLTVYTLEKYKVVEVPKSGSTFAFSRTGSGVTDGTTAIDTVGEVDDSTNGEYGYDNIVINNDTTAVTIRNNQVRNNVLITKTTNADYDYATNFKVRVQFSTDGGNTFTDLQALTLNVTHHDNTTGTVARDAIAGGGYQYSIKKGDVITVPDVVKGTIVRVIESDYVSGYYTFGGITSSNVTLTNVDGNNYAKQFTMGTADANITISNEFIPQTIRVTKKIYKKNGDNYSDYEYNDGSKFTMHVDLNPHGSGANYDPLGTGLVSVNGTGTATAPTGDGATAAAAGNYVVEKDGYIQFNNIPKGSRVEIQETAVGISPITGEQRFTTKELVQSAKATDSSAPNLATGYITVDSDLNLVQRNIVKVNDVVIKKETDSVDTTIDHTIHINAWDNGKPNHMYDGKTPHTATAAISTISYTRKTLNNVVTTESTSTGNITIHHGDTITLHYPVGTYYEITETAGTLYSYYNVSADTPDMASSTGGVNVPAPSVNTATGEVKFQTKDAKPEITYINNRNEYTYTITKQTNINNTDDVFKIKVWVKDNANVTDWTQYRAAIGQHTADATTGEYTIKKDETFTISGLKANSLIKVEETDVNSPKYAIGSIDAVGTDADFHYTQGETSAYTTVNADKGLVITNNVQTTTVTINKSVTGGATGKYTEFPLTVKITNEVTGSTATYNYTSNYIGDTNHVAHTGSVTNGTANSDVKIWGTETLTFADIPVGATVEVTERTMPTGYSCTSIGATGGANVTSNIKPNVTFKTTGSATAAVAIVNAVATHNVTITKAISNSNNSIEEFSISASIKPDGADDTAVTTWTRSIASAASASGSLSGMAIKNGESIVLENVPEGAEITVSEAAETDFTCQSIVAMDGNSTVIASANASTLTFTVPSSNATVTVTNKINDKTVTIHKVTDTATTGKSFKIKAQYTPTNTNTLTDYISDSFSAGYATLDKNDAATVTVPKDASVTITELTGSGDMPADFEFEKITVGSTTAAVQENGYTYTGTTNEDIYVHNTELHSVNLYKTTNNTTTDTFTFGVYKWDDANSNWVLVENKTVSANSNTAQTTSKVFRKGDLIKVVETSDVTGKYTFDYSSSSVSGDADSTTYSQPTGEDGYENITMGTSDVEVTLRNTVNTQNVIIKKTTDSAVTGETFTFSLSIKYEGDNDENVTSFNYAKYTEGDTEPTSSSTAFSGGTFTLTKNQNIKIFDVPIGATVEVQETGKNGYTPVISSNVTATINGDTATMEVPTGDTIPTIIVNNTKSKVLTISKVTDIHDTTKAFKIKVLTGDNYENNYTGTLGTDYTASAGVTLSNGEFTIHDGENVQIIAATGTKFRVYETDIPADYTLASVTPTTATAYPATGATIGRDVQITDSNIDVTFTNNVVRHNVTITKAVSNLTTADTFPISVTLNDPTTDSSVHNNYTYTYNGTNTAGDETITDGSDETITLAQNKTVTIQNVPYGTTFTVNEAPGSSSRYNCTGITVTGAADAGTQTGDTTNRTLVFTTANAQADVTVTNAVKTQDLTITKTVTNSAKNDDNFPITVTIKPDGSSGSAQTQWVYTDSTASIQPLDPQPQNLPTTIKNGQTYVISNVPVGAYVSVSEGDISSTNYTFSEIVVSPSVTETTGTRSTAFNMPAEDETVTIKNTINNKTVTIKKVVDDGTATFPILVEVKNSNANDFSNYSGTGFNNGKVNIESGSAGVQISVPLDAEVRVSELTADIPTGYQFSKFTKQIGSADPTDETAADVTNGSSTVIGKSYTYTGTDDATITVHNLKVQNGLTIKKVCDDGDPGSSTFRISVTYRRQSDSSDQTSYVDVANGGSEVINLPYGTIIKEVTETPVTGYVLDRITMGAADTEAFALFTLLGSETITVHNRLTKHTVTIEKEVVNESGTSIADSQVFNLSVQQGSSAATSQTFSKGSPVTLNNVPYGTVVTATETTPLPRGYEFVSYSANNGQAITGDTTITVTNRKLSPHGVKIKKVVDKDSGGTEFGMKISTTDIPYSYRKYDSSDAQQGTAVDMSSGGEATFNLKKDEYVIVSGLYKDEVLTVQETYNGSEYAFEKFVVNSADYTGTVTNQAMSYTVLSSPAVQTIDVSNVNAITTKYNITYNFTSYRSLYGDMSYSTGAQDFTATELTSLTSGTVKNVSGGDVTALKFNTVTAMKSFIDNHAPYEDGFRESVTWISGKVDNTDTNISTKFVTAPTYSDLAENGVKLSYNEAGNLLTIIVNAYQTDVGPVEAIFKLPYKTTDSNKSLVPDGETPERINPLARDAVTTAQQGLVVIDGNLYQAPEKLSDGKYFSYWKMYTPVQDIFNSSDTNKPYSKCYSRSFNFVLYQDSIIEAVYDNSEPVSPHDEAVKDGNDQKATITFMENSRTQWNGYPDDNTTKYKDNVDWQLGDRVYTDFLLSFEYNDLQLNTDNSGTYEYGIVIETLDDVTTMANWDPVKGATEYTQSDYSAKFGSTHNENDVKTFIQSGSAGSHTYSKSQKSVKGLDNKNRVDFYHAMALITQKHSDVHWGEANNKENNVYRAYSYLINKKTGEVLLVSDPLYFTVYDIANINYQASATP